MYLKKYIFLYVFIIFVQNFIKMTDKKSVKTSPEKDPLLILIGEKVRSIRKSDPEYVNYEVFAFKNGINKVTLSKIEKGENHNIASLIKVLAALNVSLEDFFKGIK